MQFNQSDQTDYRFLDGSQIEKFVTYPFPRWVKISAVGLAALVAFSAFWNLRFVKAIYEMKNVNAALEQGDMGRAALSAYAAYGHVPEYAYLRALSSYFQGLEALQNDDSAAAVQLFQIADPFLHESFGTWVLLRQALVGKAFDEKDYASMIASALEITERHPQGGFFQASLSSAYACQYAVSGKPEFREQALQILAKARSLIPPDDAGSGLDEYEQRIMHRLETREIITRDEFALRFPDGWTNESKAENNEHGNEAENEHDNEAERGNDNEVIK